MILPLISVVIPAYNAADTILNCINSVLQQTVSIYEIIIVNDGSLDNTESIVNEYKVKRNQRNLYIISQPNGGPAKARNRGIMEAKGDWISFLDADDRWLPEKTALQLNILELYPESRILGTFLYSDKPEKRNNNHYKIPTFTKMLFKNYFSTSTVMVRKDVIIKYYFDEMKRYSEDHKLWLQIIKSDKGVVLCKGLVIFAETQSKYNRKSISSNLWKMEKGELESYIYFYKQHSLNFIMLLIVISFSFLKFIRRGLLKYI
jgi:glycosyltransferase involved in cell wall biosynthesis